MAGAVSDYIDRVFAIFADNLERLLEARPLRNTSISPAAIESGGRDLLGCKGSPGAPGGAPARRLPAATTRGAGSALSAQPSSSGGVILLQERDEVVDALVVLDAAKIILVPGIFAFGS
jgi:hypothetical protein